MFVDVIGFSPLEAIGTATRWGAELMRMQDRVGTLEPGKLADLVVVDGATRCATSACSRIGSGSP